MDEKIRSHKDLQAWQEAMVLVTEIYRLSENFPESEKFGLTSQIRRVPFPYLPTLQKVLPEKAIKNLYSFYTFLLAPCLNWKHSTKSLKILII